jgi:cytochrome b
MQRPLNKDWHVGPRRHLRRANAHRQSEPAGTIPVWDAGTRLFHWGLVAAVSVAGLTGFWLGRTTLAWHLWAGIVVIVAVVWRLVWGGLGPTYARFSSFAYPPVSVLSHIRDALSGTRVRHLGHNPLGALMVFALIGTLAAIVLTGAFALGGLLKQGPLRAFLTYATGRQWLGVHRALAIFLLAMVGAHVAGVAFESWRGQENLVGAMLSGRKPTRPPAETAPPVSGHPRTALGVTLGVLTAAAALAASLAGLPGWGVPPVRLDPVFEEQCGSCHLAFPPSLAPAATWDRIMADTQHHFGTDMGLPPELVAHIHAFLDANSAEHWDTLPSHLLRTPATDGGSRISDMPGWQRVHRHIPAWVFAAKPIYRRSNCEACHADAATGRFAPQDIAIPKRSAP